MFFTLQGVNSGLRGAGDVGNQVSSATGLPVLLHVFNLAVFNLV